MKKVNKSEAKKLRLKAERILKEKSPSKNSELSEVDKLKLIHELEVHQIELEMQNEELIVARSTAETAADKFTELYDFAPFGYFTVSKEGKIIELNISGAKLFNKNREDLKNRMLNSFIAPESIPVFNKFLKKAFANHQQESCEVNLSVAGNNMTLVQLTGIIPENSEYCRISMVDLTEKKQIQNALLNAILMAEENEKSNFSHELNENLGPLLSVIKLYLSSIDITSLNEKQQEHILKSKELLNEAVTIVREISSKLSPHTLMKFGLTSAIKEYIDKVDKYSRLGIKFSSNLQRRLQSEIEITLFRATIEFINNSLKYAQAKNMIINLFDSGKSIILTYKDDGVGFDIISTISTRRGYGLINLENRINAINGECKFESKPGFGVHYEVIIKS